MVTSHRWLNKGDIMSRELSKADLKELVESIVRAAVAEQARELEKHLNDIHVRLQALEKNAR